ncbi:hypothetical protein, partial [Rhizobium sp. L245/93]|uniref:hypothetical protein n=1 Tax=Rhizobium sp. L245/93 TaxID=2819998 RepID=UPI001ADCF71F
RRQSPQKRRGFSCKVETPIAKEKLNLRSSANAYSSTGSCLLAASHTKWLAAPKHMALSFQGA